MADMQTTVPLKRQQDSTEPTPSKKPKNADAETETETETEAEVDDRHENTADDWETKAAVRGKKANKSRKVENKTKAREAKRAALHAAELAAALASELADVKKQKKANKAKAKGNDGDSACDGDNDSDTDNAPGRKKTDATKKTRRRRELPPGVKACKSAYQFFLTKYRPSAQPTDADPAGKLSLGMHSRLSGVAWKALNDADRKPYLDLAEDDRARFSREMLAAGVEVKPQRNKK
jgi:hypothetical protein